MALPTNTFTTYSAIGNREDLSNEIYRVEVTDTPFITMAERKTATAVKHEWQTQALAAANTDNAQLEGDDATSDAITPTVRLDNQCQISRKVAQVAGTQEAVDHAGRDSEMAYQEMLKGLELKRDMEGIIVGTNRAKVTGGAGTPRRLASILSWIGTNDDFGAGGASPTTLDGAATRTDGTQRVFTETQLKNVLKLICDGGGKADTISVGTFNKQQFSTFTGRSTPQEMSSSKKIVNTVEAYEGDFGKLKVIFNRHQRARDCLILDSNMWAVAYLSGRKFVSIPLAKTGDNMRRMILSEYSLEARNEKSSGGVFDLTTS